MAEQMDKAILLVELGRVPSYLWVNLAQLRAFNPSARIVLATDQPLQGHPQITKLGIEVFMLDISALSGQGPEGLAFSQRYKRRFWYFTSLRFLALRHVIHSLQIEQCIHVESDYLLYVPIDTILERIPRDCTLGLNCEGVRVIPGMMFIRGEGGADLAWHAVSHGLQEGLADFDSLPRLFERKDQGVYAFPTQDWIGRTSAGERRFLDLDGALMDAAKLGQLVLGTDRRPFKSNLERGTSLGLKDLVYFSDPARCDRPFLRKGGKTYPIWGLHTHAKRLECLATFSGPLDSVSGCKCLDWADWVVGLNEGYTYAVKVGVDPSKLILVEDESRIPGVGEIVAVSGDEVYRLPENWLMRARAQGGMVFLVINSDRDHQPEDLHRILGRRNIVFAQNLLTLSADLPHIRPIPIGVQNRIWSEINVNSSMTTRTRKAFGILSALSSTHRSRIAAVFWSLVMAQRLPHLEKPLEIRIHRAMGLIRCIYRRLRTLHVYGYRMPVSRWRRLLRGSFFVLSLRGNGADTHRFWEGQYHGSIPLLRHQDDLPAYQGWPRLVRKLRPIFLRGIRQQDITDAMARRDVRLIKGAREYEQEVRLAARTLAQIDAR